MISLTSSPPLHGSSRTTGGRTHGLAAGNVFNFADADINLDPPVLRTGKIHVYNSPVNPIEVKPFQILKINFGFSMAPVLNSIAEKWSPIESLLFQSNYYIIYNNLIIETNPQISVYEQREWIDKGRYNAVVSFDEDIEWMRQKRDCILPVCYVSDFYCPE